MVRHTEVFVVGAKGVGELQRKQQEALEVSWKLGELGRLAGSVFGPSREIGRGGDHAVVVYGPVLSSKTTRTREGVQPSKRN